MSRKLPENFSELTVESLKFEKQDDGRITQTRRYKLITPLFGGGVEAKKADPIKVIRETSIRGQLRFWWRAMRGDGDLKTMLQREGEIFGIGGENAKQSKVLISVTVDNKGNGEKIFEVNHKGKLQAKKQWEKIAYAAFPLDEPDQKEVLLDVEFSLKIIFPKYFEITKQNGNSKETINLRAEIEAALWAWETFGGIGGRTRRGFGALELLSVTENEKSVEIKKYEAATAAKDIKRDLQVHLLKGKHCNEQTPHLTAKSVLDVKAIDYSTATEAWSVLIEKLQSFRQFRLKNKDQYGNEIEPVIDKHGKSQWSEPDSIRYLVLRGAKPEVVKFPRSEFGLPINFYFETPRKDKNGLLRLSKNNKPEVKLTAADDTIDRLASPLILRPIRCADKKCVALGLILNSPRKPENGIALKNIKSGSITVLPTLDENEFAVLAQNGLTPLKNKTDVLQAFLDYLKN